MSTAMPRARIASAVNSVGNASPVAPRAMNATTVAGTGEDSAQCNSVGRASARHAAQLRPDRQVRAGLELAVLLRQRDDPRVDRLEMDVADETESELRIDVCRAGVLRQRERARIDDGLAALRIPADDGRQHRD